jgi:hypothetical protein
MAGKPGRSGRKGAGKEFADFQKLWQQWSDAAFIADLIRRNALGSLARQSAGFFREGI